MNTEILTKQDIHSFIDAAPNNRRDVVKEKLNIVLKPTRG